MFNIFSRSFRVIAVTGIIIGMLIIGVIFRFTNNSVLQKHEEIPWGGSLAVTTGPALSENKFVVVDVYTDTCSLCKKLDKEVFTDADLIRFLQRDFICVKLNAGDMGEGTAVASTFGVTSYPCALVFSPEGKLVGQVNGYLEAPQYLSMLKDILAQSRQDPSVGSQE